MKKKVIGKWTLFVVVGALIVWCATRWNVWFHNSEEAPYVPSEVPTRVLLTFGDEDGMNRNVSWMCDTALHEAWVELEDENTHILERVGATGEVFESRSGNGTCLPLSRLYG